MTDEPDELPTEPVPDEPASTDESPRDADTSPFAELPIETIYEGELGQNPSYLEEWPDA